MLKWRIFEFDKPKKSGFYFVKCGGIMEIAYYDQIIEDFIFYDGDCKLLMVNYSIAPLKWAKMPRFSRSRLLDKGYICL